MSDFSSVLKRCTLEYNLKKNRLRKEVSGTSVVEP
jgi:hypothetical protein